MTDTTIAARRSPRNNTSRIDDQDDGLDQHLLHRPDRLADEFAAVVEHLDAAPSGSRRLELGELAP